MDILNFSSKKISRRESIIALAGGLITGVAALELYENINHIPKSLFFGWDEPSIYSRLTYFLPGRIDANSVIAFDMYEQIINPTVKEVREFNNKHFDKEGFFRATVNPIKIRDAYVTQETLHYPRPLYTNNKPAARNNLGRE